MLDAFEAMRARWPADMSRVLDASCAERERLWDILGADADLLRRKYAWCIPNERAVRVLCHVSPVVELGAGKGYWSWLVSARGGSISAYDKAPPRRPFFPVIKGQPDFAFPTLFLCYSDDPTPVNDDDAESESCEALSLESLNRFEGDTIVLAGEAFVASGTLSLTQAPWGRSFDSAFQVELAATFHCVFVDDLPRFPICKDTLSVWKRTRVCRSVVADDEEEEDDAWADIPDDERLPCARAAPCMLPLLTATGALLDSMAYSRRRRRRRRR